MTTPLSRALASAIGKRMRALRRLRHLSQAQVAVRSNSYRPIVARLESGRHEQSIAEIVRYARAIGVEPIEIFRVVDAVVDAHLGGVPQHAAQPARASHPWAGAARADVARIKARSAIR